MWCAGLQACQALSDALSEREGGASAIRHATAIPRLFQLSPSDAGPAASVPFPVAPSLAPVYHFLHRSHRRGDERATLWPVMAPAESSDGVSAMRSTIQEPYKLSLDLPPYMTLASTRLLATAMQLSAKVKAACSAACATAARCWTQAVGAEGPPSASTGGSPMSSSLVVGAGGYRAPMVVGKELSVRFGHNHIGLLQQLN